MSIIRTIDFMFKHAFEKQWYETYWAIDLHGTIIKPTYKGTEMEYYPMAKETLQLLTKRDDIKLILWTSSFPNEIEEYLEGFKKDNIIFNSINANPGISSKNGNFGYYEDKFYFNILLDDKAGFDPIHGWEMIYHFFEVCEMTGRIPDKNWTTKY